MYEAGFTRPEKPPSPSHKAAGRSISVINDTGQVEWNTGENIDLHKFLTGLSPHVKLIKIVGNLMRPSGLHHGQYAVIDSSIQPYENCLAAVRFNGHFIIRRLQKRQGRWCLTADDPREETLYIQPSDNVERVGVVKAAIIKTTQL